MSQPFDRQILDYLARKENLSLALEIGNYAVQLRRELFDRFWIRVEQAIKDSCPKGRSCDAFVFKKSGAMDARYASLSAVPNIAAARDQYLAFTVEHDHLADSYDLNVGLCWARHLPRNDPLYERSPLRKLKEHLLAERWEDWAPGWVCGRYVQDFPSPEIFLCTFTDDPTGVLAPLITAFWEMVRDTEAAVTAVNRLVAAK